MSTTIQTIPVILSTEKDWDKWIELIKTMSLKFNLWDHINPSLPESQLKTLIQPERPTPNTVHPPPAPAQASASSYSSPYQEGSSTQPATQPAAQPPPNTKFLDLSADKHEHLCQLNKDYLYKRRTYDKQ